MKVVCDADGLIKMAKAGILEAFARRVDLLVAPRVYQEAVEEGKARGYPDAWEIERILQEHGHVLQPPRRGRKRPPEEQAINALPLGAGEKETLAAYVRERADVVLSDDRAFLHALEAQGVPYLTPAAALVLLARQREGTLSREEALQALERLRPWIRREQYEAARRDLEALNADADEDEGEKEERSES